MPSGSTLTPKAQLATFFDLLAIPEESRRHEVLDGEILEKALPRGEHGFTQSRVNGCLLQFDRRYSPASPSGWWFATEPVHAAPFELIELQVAVLFGDDPA